MRNGMRTNVFCCAVIMVAMVAGVMVAEANGDRKIIRNEDGTVDCSAYANSPYAEPAIVRDQCGVSEPGDPWVSGNAQRAPTDTGYAQDIGYISENFVSFTLNDFPGQTVMAQSTIAYYGMDFDQAATTLWALNNDTDELGTIDLVTGAFTGIVPCPPPALGSDPDAIWSGLTIDPSTGVFYGCDATELYTIDPATGANTLVGTFGTTGAIMIDIAMNMAGEMYGHDIGDDAIYSVDLATGAATLIGATGYDANYAQGMDFDNDDGTLYVFLYIGSGANVFGTVDLATGAVTPLATDNPTGEFEGAIQIAGSESLGCANDPVAFEDGIPLLFTVVDNAGNGVVWTTTGTPECPRTNETNGTGEAACVDTDTAGSIAYDTEMVSNPFSLAGATAANLTASVYYYDVSTGANDVFEVDLWDGVMWNNILFWDEDHQPEDIDLDLSTWVGMSDLQVRFRYSGDGYDWWLLVDDVNVNCSLPGISLTKTVGTVPAICATTDEITVPTGSDIIYCYVAENIGNIPLNIHDLVDDQLGTILSSFPQVLNPGEDVELLVGVTNVVASVTNSATWTAYNDGPTDVVESTDTATVNVVAPHPLVCEGTVVGFDAGLPPDWTVVDNMGTGVVWAPTGLLGYPMDCNEGNYTDGSGIAACASSDGFGSANYDTELIPPAINFSGYGFATLFFDSNYQDISPGGGDRFDVDLSFDGGSSWVNVMSWDEDHGTLNGSPGEYVSLDLTPFGIGGQPSVLVRFHNYSDSTSNPYDWYAQVDNVLLECIIPVELQSFSVE